jgi:hypothetical protein
VCSVRVYDPSALFTALARVSRHARPSCHLISRAIIQRACSTCRKCRSSARGGNRTLWRCSSTSLTVSTVCSPSPGHCADSLCRINGLGVHEEEKKRLLARRKESKSSADGKSKDAEQLLPLDFTHPTLLRALSDEGKLPAELQRTVMEQIFGGPSCVASGFHCWFCSRAHRSIAFLLHLQARCAARLLVARAATNRRLTSPSLTSRCRFRR